MKTTARVGRSGRAQIPKDIRESLGISYGDQLVIDVLEVIKAPSEKEREAPA